MPLVLCLTPNPARRPALEDACRRGGLVPRFASGPQEMAEAEADGLPDLVVVDGAALSPSEVRQALEQARTWRRPALVILPETALEAFDPTLAGDEFLVDPPRAQELAARLRHLLWRVRGGGGDRVIQVGDLVIDPERYEVRVAGRPVILTYKEYELLKLLASHPGRVFSREVLLDRVWGYQYFGGTRTVDVHIRRIRSKLASVSPKEYIETVWNVGYRFRDPQE